MKGINVRAAAALATVIGVALLAFFLGRIFPSNSSEFARVVNLVGQNRVEVERLEEAFRPLSNQLKEILAVIPSARPPAIQQGGSVKVTDLLDQARKLCAKKNLRGAEIVVTKAVQIEKDNVPAWRSLADVQRKLAISSIAAGNLLLAAQELDRARSSVNGVIGISVDPSTPKMDPKIVVDEETATAEVSEKVREAIDSTCELLISKANEWAEFSHWRWYTASKNNRDGVVEGLKYLKTVFELGPWASEQIRTSANDAYSKLKKLVYPEEWNDLLARAGFDPSSRDTLRKWGLE